MLAEWPTLVETSYFELGCFEVQYLDFPLVLPYFLSHFYLDYFKLGYFEYPTFSKIISISLGNDRRSLSTPLFQSLITKLTDKHQMVPEDSVEIYRDL